tara:strand:+ start:279 stop:398 length:120 start_codon:yes stop_codon:yes gene_type:complete
MNEETLINKIDTELESKRGFGLTDDEVQIVQRVKELLTN